MNPAFLGQGFSFGFLDSLLDFWEPGIGFSFSFVIFKGFGFVVYQSFDFATIPFGSPQIAWLWLGFVVKASASNLKRVKASALKIEKTSASASWHPGLGPCLTVSLSLLLQCPSNISFLFRIFSVILGRFPYSCSYVRSYLVVSLASLLGSKFQNHRAALILLHSQVGWSLYVWTGWISSFFLSLLHALHASALWVLTSASVLAIHELMYLKSCMTSSWDPSCVIYFDFFIMIGGHDCIHYRSYLTCRQFHFG